jgi:hypothetical protein
MKNVEVQICPGVLHGYIMRGMRRKRTAIGIIPAIMF